ncbi:unnamed protein product (macronuclear) [Paramecium tetraurelia]|uniref:Dihydrolipoamide acetyltransferase component of pyruvate dehydrogenase complex n=1 Tax=Paramecium tetraurelia TaxID=5888 RepID=A0D1R4_PARTE|nr:uncharacterized protein GSPATT00012505001 [Paramecium tetraurelia]CAK76981.1 unnamed protein product [Paramecium tetraurelia]|eukprot:XP_001444378.1 hypothetical protein (macronuclear) [Paramecium tetraurelia strain d4-2]
MNIYSRFLSRYYFGAVKIFKLPDLGEKIKEATIKKWHVKIGDHVNEFDPVADVSTDKMFTQIPSNYTGKIHKLFHQEDETCLVGGDFLEIEIESDNQESATPQTQHHQVKQEVTKQQEVHQTIQTNNNASNHKLATPAVRHLAKQKGIDLNKIQGSGQDGRILKTDLEKQTQSPKEQPQSSTKINIKSESASTVIKMSDFQKGMQKSMTEANSIPHLYLKEEVDLTELAQMREQLKKEKNITFMTLLIKSFSLALTKYPILNSTYDPTKQFEYTQHSSHNVSVALDSPKGLVVPNIKNVQNLSISQIQDELNRLRILGEKGQLSFNELSGGTICLSNIGTIGGTYTGPLILAPQVCIVGIGRLMTVPRYDAKMNVVPRKIMNLSFGCDHRVIDGATVARFNNVWKTYLENPTSMFIHLK